MQYKHIIYNSRLSLACAALLGSAAMSQAAVIVSENFTYADGCLNWQNADTGFSGAWTPLSMSLLVSRQGTILQYETFLPLSVVPDQFGRPSTVHTIPNQIFQTLAGMAY